VNDIILDRYKLYAGAGEMVVVHIAIPTYATVNLTDVSGNGSTVTASVASAEGHALATSDVVDIVGITPSGYNQTSASITVLNVNQFTYSNSTTGTPTGSGSYVGYAQTDKVAVDFVYMNGCEMYTAPNYSTNGTGVLPNSAPPSSWSTCDTTAHSISNGNIYMTYSSTPSWTFYTSTPS
jgi:hypothetical protein